MSAIAAAEHRSCECGAVYRRIVITTPVTEIGDFECLICGSTLETWTTGKCQPIA
jgi:hypothetical protein